MTTILEQQFVAHIFAPAEGPHAPAADAALRAIWRGCGQLYQMTEPISESGLPLLLPDTLQSPPASVSAGGEVALAGRERPAGVGQAILRLDHDVLNLSIGIAHTGAWPLPLLSGSDSAALADMPDWWHVIDFSWNLLCERYSDLFLGETRLYLARLDAGDEIGPASAGLYASLRPLLPPTVTDGQDPSTGVPVQGDFALWEVARQRDDRTLRQFLFAIAADSDPVASAWVWSGGNALMPPLARYLLHAAKLRYEMRVWQRDSQSRQLEEALDSLGAEIERLGGQDPERAALLALRNNEAKRLRADLGTLRKTVEIAADNMARSVDLADLLVPDGPFTDDANLARFLLGGLEDEIDYLGLAIQKADLVPTPVRPPAERQRGRERAENPTVFGVEQSLDDNRRRNVFVVHGRDDTARRSLFEFLRALDLRPLEWELLVQGTGSAAPSLRQAVRQGLLISTAVIVLMTPDDIVRLHPDLHDHRENDAEARDNMQSRPNVLLELGMALAVKPDHTLLVYLGEQRPVTDLRDINYVQIGPGRDWRHKIAIRLEQAGCSVDSSGQDWLHAGDFDGLAALNRVPAAGQAITVTGRKPSS